MKPPRRHPGAIANAAKLAIHDPCSNVIGISLVSDCNCGRNIAENPIVKPAEIVAVIGAKAAKICNWT